MTLPPGEPEPVVSAAEVALRTLRDADTALARVTGGAPPRQVMAELARQTAGELAQHFGELPMHRYAGRVARVPGVLGALVPGRRVPHRVVMARYLSTGIARRSSGGSRWSLATIAILGLGADGGLRVGALNEAVHRDESTDLFQGSLRWDDHRVRGVPSRTLWVRPWEGGSEREQVGTAPEVLTALAAIARTLAGESLRDLEMLKRLLDTGG